eukprot:86833-Rhodomonas_salina.1
MVNCHYKDPDAFAEYAGFLHLIACVVVEFPPDNIAAVFCGRTPVPAVGGWLTSSDPQAKAEFEIDKDVKRKPAMPCKTCVTGRNEAALDDDVEDGASKRHVGCPRESMADADRRVWSAVRAGTFIDSEIRDTLAAVGRGREPTRPR